jgi:ATP-dependent DNA helicase PIF1
LSRAGSQIGSPIPHGDFDFRHSSTYENESLSDIISRSSSPSTRRRPVGADEPDPSLDVADDGFSLDNPALNQADELRLHNFHIRINAQNMQHCNQCNERIFLTEVRNGVCGRCRKENHQCPVPEQADNPFLFGTLNDMDPGVVPGLPPLSQVEEMLIARVHIHVEVYNVRGSQHKYVGQVCNFLQNVGKVYDHLPPLPKDLDMVIVKPRNASTNPRLARQFINDFRVRRNIVREWLEFLNANHPGYRDIIIDGDALDQLPLDHHVLSDIAVQYSDDAPADSTPEGPQQDNPRPISGAIPDVLPVITDVDQLREEFGEEPQQPQAPSQQQVQPKFRIVPLSDFNKTEALLSRAFPTLFPFGRAEFVLPRARKVSYPAYIKHLMKYHDSRFAGHARFPYVAFNAIMRSTINTRSTYFSKKKPGEAALTVEDLRAAFASDDSPTGRALLQSIVSYSGSLRGTRPFWNGRRSQVEAMVRTLGTPALFVTFSAADYWWDSLQRHMPTYQAWKSATTTAQKVKIAQDAIRDNPHVVAYHFVSRFTAFMETVVIPKFRVTDYFNRYEWQARGSPHNHGFLWVEDQPNFNINSLQEFAEAWGLHISAYNPRPSHELAVDEVPLTSLESDAQHNTFAFLSSILAHVQGHKCTDYCLRKKRGSEERTCRFYYPQEERDEPVVFRDPLRNPQHFTFFAERNDSLLHKYNRAITMGWLANTDISPCTNIQAVINYLAKFCTKAEGKSDSYKDLLTTILPSINETNPLISMVAKLMNKLVGERDFSTQEVCHMLLDLPLANTSRTVISVDCRPEVNQPVGFDVEGSRVVRGKTLLQKYKTRDVEYENLTYHHILTRFEMSGKSIKPLARASTKDRICRFFPLYSSNPQDDTYEEYCRVKLMLHHTFHEVKDLL